MKMFKYNLKKVINMCLVLICLYFIAGVESAFAQVIRKIEILGNKTIASKEIIAVIEVKKGDEFEEDSLNQDIRNIYNLGFFDEVVLDVEPFEKGIKVVFKVAEKTLIKRVDFKGNKKFSNKKLKGEISLKEKEAFDQKKMEEDTEKITLLYKGKGFADVKVEAFTTTLEKEGLVIVTFFVTEGNRITINEITLTGVKGFPLKKVLKKIKTKKKKIYKEEVFNTDLKTLESFYKQKGYMEIKISEPQINYNSERTEMYIEIPIDEGVQFKVGEITFTGNTVFEEGFLKKKLDLVPGKIFNDNKYKTRMMIIQSVYAEKGYIRMEINPQIGLDREKKLVNVNFKLIERGKVYIDKIYIEGNTITREYVIRRELLIKEGDPFNVGKIRRTQEKIYNLGFFSDVKIDVEQTDVADKADLVLSLSEQKTGLASVGAGYSSQDGVLGTMQVSQTNLFGRGQKITLLWEFGEKKQNYEIGFTERWMFGTRTSFGCNVFDMVRIKDYIYTTEEDIEKTDRYKEGRKGGDLRIGRRLTDKYSTSLTYAYEEIKIFDTDSEYMQTQEGINTTSSFTHYFIRDSRDNVFDASRGSKNSFSTEVAGGILGGDNNFTKNILSTSWFCPTIWRFVLAFNAEVGRVEEFGRSDSVPIYEKFYVGGAESVRGYDYRGQIGPAEGGNYMAVFNVEYKFPIVTEKGHTILQGAIFADAGGSWTVKDKMTLEIGSRDGQMKAGFGAGIRFKTPVFPIRLDWGYGLNHKDSVPEANRHQWYFTIGQLF